MATHDERSAAALSSTLAWLEEELREAKTLIVRQQQAIDQLGAQLWETTTALHRAEDQLAALTPRLDLLPQFDDRLRDAKDEIGRVHDHGLGVESRLNELARIRQLESDRDLAALNDLSHRMDAAERGIQNGAPRFDALDEASRRAMESVTYVRQRVEEVARGAELVEGRVGRFADSVGRTEHEFTRLGSEIENLHRQDATLADRLQIYTEMLKRLETQIGAVSAEVAVKQDVLERIEITRLELHRLEERTSLLEATIGDLREQDEDAARGLNLVDGRVRGVADRLAGLQSDIAGHRAQVTEQFQRLHQSQERQKRRQIEDLEREIRELRIHAFRPVDE